jgi:ribosomal subunit interface protein
MEKRILFRHMEHSKVLEEYANEQLAKIEHFLENEREPIYIGLTFEPSKVHAHHKVELLVKTPHYDLISSYEHKGEAFYETLDRVIDVMYRELHEKKKLLKKDKVKTTGRHDDFKKER